MEPTKIFISSLAARYYVRDGWSLDIIKKYLIEGSFAEMDATKDTYYILEVGSSIDVVKLLSDYPNVILDSPWSGERGKSNKEILESRNWRISGNARNN